MAEIVLPGGVAVKRREPTNAEVFAGLQELGNIINIQFQCMMRLADGWTVPEIIAAFESEGVRITIAPRPEPAPEPDGPAPTKHDLTCAYSDCHAPPGSERHMTAEQFNDRVWAGEHYR